MISAEEYLYEIGLTEEQIKGKIQQKIASVGGLLSEEGALLLIAGEKGWGGEAIVNTLSDLSDTGIEQLYKLGRIVKTSSYVHDPITVKVLKVYDAEKPPGNYVDKRTKVQVYDINGVARYFNFDDKPLFERVDNATGETKTIPANFMSTAMQLIRKDIIGKTIEIQDIEINKYNGNYYFTTTNFTKFKNVNTLETEEYVEYTEEVPIEDLEAELKS